MHRRQAPRGRSLSTGLVAIILLLTSFLPTASSTRATGSPASLAGILRISNEIGSTPPSLDPPMVEADGMMLMGLIFGGLVGLDENLHVVPDGADSWSVDPTGRIYTFHIRARMRLGDGTAVTAEDYAWSLNRALTPQFANGLASYYLSNIKGATDVTNKKSAWVSGIKVLAPDRLQITLNQPSGTFLQQLAFPTSDLVPRAMVARLGDKWTAQAVGTGPFRVKRWLQKQVLVLVPNPYYWRGHLALHELDVELTDAEGAFTLFRQGNLDVMGAIAFPWERLGTAQSLPDYHVQHLLQTDYLVPNLKTAPFDKLAVRQAFSYAIDRSALARGPQQNTVFPATGILPPGLPGYNAGLHGQVYDPARARRLLAQAGYADGKGLPAVSLLVDASDSSNVKEAQALQAAWKSVLGVTVEVQRSSDHNAYIDALNGHHFQLALSSWAADYPDPQDVLSLQLHSGGTPNVGSYSNATFDRLTSAADMRAPTDATRYTLYQQAEQIAVDDAAWIVLDWGRSAVMIRPEVHGLVVTSLGVTAPDWTRVTVR